MSWGSSYKTRVHCDNSIPTWQGHEHEECANSETNCQCSRTFHVNQGDQGTRAVAIVSNDFEP